MGKLIFRSDDMYVCFASNKIYDLNPSKDICNTSTM
jgi:hypothetical protein